MEGKKQVKIKLNTLIIVLILIIGIIILGSIYIRRQIDKKVLGNKYLQEQNKNNVVEEDEKNVQGACIIKGENSNLIYKNEYENGTAYLEKLIYLDEESKNAMKGMLSADETLYIGNLKGNYVDIKYTSNLNDYETSLAYMMSDSFYNCKTNKVVRNAIDKDGNKVEIPKLKEDYTAEKPNQNLKFYTIYDVTTADNENYVVIMYDETFENTNVVMITVVLKNEQSVIDINSDEQVKELLEKYTNYEIENVDTKSSNDYEKVTIKGKTYYHRLNENTWNGNYHQDEYYIDSKVDMQKVVSYNEYLKCINEINSQIDEMIEKTNDSSWEKYYNKMKLSNYYENKELNYIVLGYSTGGSWCTIDLIDCFTENGKIIIYGKEDSKGSMASGSGYFIAIPTNMPTGTEIEFRQCYTTEEIKNLQNYGNAKGSILSQGAYKPIIYLYPENEIQINVKLGYPELATCVYPEYDLKSGWNVLAKTNGDLIDLNTNRNLYALYYESKNKKEYNVTDGGFVVSREDTVKFLEEKLEILGLNDREAEEFIIYWLPKLQENEYNYIRFASMDEINENMPLEFSQQPDTLIRILMTYKGLNAPIQVKEQMLEKIERKGFTAVEWGGSEIK